MAGSCLHGGVFNVGSRTRSLLTSAAVAALLTSGCAEIGTPDLGEGVSGPATTAVSSADPAGAELAPEVVSAKVSPVFSPSRASDYTPLVLASTTTGLLTIDPDGTVTAVESPFNDSSVVSAVDDYFGGVVAEVQGSVVQWLPANSTEAQLVSQGNGTLLEAGFLDASLAVQIFLSVAGGVDRVKLVDGEREPFTRLAEGEQLMDFSSSNGIQALTIRDAECGQLRFLNVSGEQVDLRGPTATDCDVKRRPKFGSVALSPDGGSVAYTEITYRGDGLPASTQLIAMELGTSAPLLSTQIGGPGEQIESLAYDGRRLTYLRTGESGREVALLAVAGDGETVITNVSGVQFVSFARLPLTFAPVEEPVEVPTTVAEGG